MAGYARASGGTAVATRSQQGPAAFPTGSFVLSRRDPNRHFAGIVPFASDPCPTNLPTHLSERHDPGLESRPPRPDERSNHENASFDRGGPPRVPPKSTTLRPASAPLIPPSSKTLGAPRMPKGISKEEQLQAILDIIPVSPGREWTGDSRSREAQNMGGMQGRSDGRRDAEDTAFLRSREEHRSSAGPAATSARLSNSSFYDSDEYSIPQSEDDDRDYQRYNPREQQIQRNPQVPADVGRAAEAGMTRSISAKSTAKSLVAGDASRVGQGAGQSGAEPKRLSMASPPVAFPGATRSPSSKSIAKSFVSENGDRQDNRNKPRPLLPGPGPGPPGRMFAEPERTDSFDSKASVQGSETYSDAEGGSPDQQEWSERIHRDQGLSQATMWTEDHYTRYADEVPPQSPDPPPRKKPTPSVHSSAKSEWIDDPEDDEDDEIGAERRPYYKYPGRHATPPKPALKKPSVGPGDLSGSFDDWIDSLAQRPEYRRRKSTVSFHEGPPNVTEAPDYKRDGADVTELGMFEEWRLNAYMKKMRKKNVKEQRQLVEQSSARRPSSSSYSSNIASPTSPAEPSRRTGLTKSQSDNTIARSGSVSRGKHAGVQRRPSLQNAKSEEKKKKGFWGRK